MACGLPDRSLNLRPGVIVSPRSLGRAAVPVDDNGGSSSSGAGSIRQSGSTVRVIALDCPSGAMQDLVAAAPGLSHVEHLILNKCQFGPREMASLGKVLSHLPKLAWLELSGNRLGSDGFAELGRYTDRMRGLKCLSVHHNSIGPVGLAGFLGTAEYLESLEDLDLAENPLGDEGARLLASSAEKLRALGRLGLFECGIGDAGVEALMDAIRRPVWLASLKDIGFRGNPVMAYRALSETYAAEHWRDGSATSTPESESLLDDPWNFDLGFLNSEEDTPLPPGRVIRPRREPTTERTIPVRQQWPAIERAVLGVFGPEGVQQLFARLKHPGEKSYSLRWVLHQIMEDRSYRVRAYSLARDPAAREGGEDKRPHANVFQGPFQKALAERDVVIAIFNAIVLKPRAKRDVPQGVDDLVFCCCQCGAIHHAEDGADGTPRRPHACRACRAHTFTPERLPQHWRWCECGIDFKAGLDASWKNEFRRGGKCPGCKRGLKAEGGQ